MVIPFDPGRKPLNDYTAHELLWGAEAQARAQANELRYYAANPTSVLPPVYVAIDVGAGASVVVSFNDATKGVAFWFAKAQLKDDGDPANDLVMLGQSESSAIALLALKARLGSQAVAAR